MLKIENVEVLGWDHAIRGMRNPKNSWGKSDSGPECPYGKEKCCGECQQITGANKVKASAEIGGKETKE